MCMGIQRRERPVAPVTCGPGYAELIVLPRTTNATRCLVAALQTWSDASDVSSGPATHLGR